MRRALAGLRAARVRPGTAVRVAGAAGAVLLLAACGPVEGNGVPASTAATTAAAPATTAPTPAPTTPAPTTPPAPTPSRTPARVAVPAVAGMSTSRATAALAATGLRWRTATLRTSRYAAGTVVSVSPAAGTRLAAGTVVTLTVARLPLVVRTPPPTTQVPAPSSCDPSYPDVCLKDGIGDYDCAGGSGNGPNYVRGPIRVLPPDPFGLDADGDGTGCEQS